MSVSWCCGTRSVCLGAYLAVVVHDGLVICFVDECLHCGLTPCVGRKVRAS